MSYNAINSTTINGKLQLVVLSAEKIHGTFKTQPLNTGLALDSHSSIEYMPSDVYLVYQQRSREKRERIQKIRYDTLRFENNAPEGKIGWYVWFLIAVGLVITATVLSIWLVRRRKSEYISVSSRE